MARRVVRWKPWGPSTVARRLPVSVALALAGTLAACGGDLTGPTPPVPGALRFSHIDAGYLHVCGLTLAGGAYCWGGNSAGMLGDGTLEARSRPTRILGPDRYTAIDAGAGHTCAIDASGAAWCWGHNDEGQLGDGTRAPRIVPTRVDGNHRFTAISAGHAHTCALDEDGAAWCWGDDSSGQLGDGPFAGTQVAVEPVRVVFDGVLDVIRAGFYQTCALDAAGGAWCWGSNVSGQNGDGTESTRHVPGAVHGGHEFRSIAPGEEFVCGVDAGDAVWCWGANRWGELAEPPVSEHWEPIEIGIDAESVSAASGHHAMGSRSYACAIGPDGRAVCWGGSVPALRTESPTPVALDDDVRLRRLTTGPRFVCGISRDGYAFCGGAGSSGALGTGDTQDRAELTPVVGPAD